MLTLNSVKNYLIASSFLHCLRRRKCTKGGGRGIVLLTTTWTIMIIAMMIAKDNESTDKDMGFNNAKHYR